MPAISCIMTTYNREPYVAVALRSVLQQTRRDFELLVWDDGSKDGTLEVVRETVAGDPRVRVVAAEHRGVAPALAAASKQLSGEYLCWVDSDDAVAPTAFEETAAILHGRPEVGLVYSRYMTMTESGQPIAIGNRCLILYSKHRLLIDFMTFQFRMIRRSCFDAVGGIDESLSSVEDYDICLKLSEVCEFAHIPRPLYLYRIHHQSLSQERRLAQINASARAIRSALRRRGMDREYELDVDVVELAGRFRLRKKHGESDEPDEPESAIT